MKMYRRRLTISTQNNTRSQRQVPTHILDIQCAPFHFFFKIFYENGKIRLGDQQEEAKDVARCFEWDPLPTLRAMTTKQGNDDNGNEEPRSV